MKKKNLITVGIVLILVILIVFTAIFIKPKKEPIKTESIVSSSEDSATIHIDDIEQTENKEESNKAESFITPDETEADKIIKEHIENKEKKKEPKTESKTSSKIDKTSSVKTQTREEGEKKLNNTASKYLKEHNIDAATAGETGEICANCGKKIWDPDKYGFFIPGMPKDYENSNYCLGTCGVTFE